MEMDMEQEQEVEIQEEGGQRKPKWRSTMDM